MNGSRKTDLMQQTKKIEFFMLINSYYLSQLSAKILEGKTRRAEKLAVELGCIQQREIEKTQIEFPLPV